MLRDGRSSPLPLPANDLILSEPQQKAGPLCRDQALHLSRRGVAKGNHERMRESGIFAAGMTPPAPVLVDKTTGPYFGLGKACD